MTVQEDLISIGMPAYNCETFIKQALDSLRRQTYSRFELIISDDASTDKTSTICRSYARKDPRILYIRQKKDLGAVNNFNYVLRKAKGKYFMWAGCDDFWDKTYIEKLYHALINNKKSVFAVSKFNNVYGSRRYDYLKNQNDVFALDRIRSLIFFMKSRNFSYCYGLYKTKNLKKIGGYHSDSRPFFHSSDYLTIFKALLIGPIAYVDELLFFKRDGGLFTLRYEILKNLAINETVVNKILRFLFFPVFYLYDFLFSVHYTLASNLNVKEKNIILFYSGVYYIRNNFVFIFEILSGIIMVAVGIIQRLFK